MVEARGAAVFCGCGGDGFKPDAVARASGGEIPAILHADLAVKGIGGNEADVAASLSAYPKLDETVGLGDFHAGEDGVFQDIAYHSRRFAA